MLFHKGLGAKVRGKAGAGRWYKPETELGEFLALPFVTQGPPGRLSFLGRETFLDLETG